MMTLSTFQAHLSSQMPLPEPPRNYLNGEEQQLLKWAASLPMQTEEEQTRQLETILTELSVADIDDELRLRLMNIVMTATDRLIATLRKHYIYEVGPLSDSQLDIMNQVKSLYYLSVLVYDAMISRETLALHYQRQKHPPHTSAWKRFISPAPASPFILAAAIYQSLLTYQKLLCEKSICYQQPPLYMWSALNQLYHLACKHEVIHTDLTRYVVTRQAPSIHQLYCQVCLHSLLNVLAMRRPSILLVQRLLPEWAAHISATLEPQTQTRVFIDLKSDQPPEYLTAMTAINPYEDHCDCLFIELEPLADYLRQRQSALLATSKGVTEYRLVTKILMAISYRYLDRQTTTSSKYSPKQRGTVITGFSDIHYRVAGHRSLMNMIAAQDLPIEHLPRYDTAPRKEATPPALEIELHDCSDTMSHFRTLRLLTAQDIVALQVSEKAIVDDDNNNDEHQRLLPKLSPLTDIFEPVTTDEIEKISDSLLLNLLATAPPRLQIMGLFLLSSHQDNVKESWSLGMVRWLTIDDEYVEVEGQILGHTPTACALRLDNRDTRSQSFIPALLLASEESLQTTCSLLVPSYHFKIDDRVIIRLNGKQKSLRLQRSLLSTEEFTQYEVIRL